MHFPLPIELFNNSKTLQGVMLIHKLILSFLFAPTLSNWDGLVLWQVRAGGPTCSRNSKVNSLSQPSKGAWLISTSITFSSNRWSVPGWPISCVSRRQRAIRAEVRDNTIKQTTIWEETGGRSATNGCRPFARTQEEEEETRLITCICSCFKRVRGPEASVVTPRGRFWHRIEADWLTDYLCTKIRLAKLREC